MASIAETTAGRVEGRAESGLHVFRGIPYAEAPLDALRFRPPEPHRPWGGVRSALAYGAWAPQELGTVAREYWGLTASRARTA